MIHRNAKVIQLLRIYYEFAIKIIQQEWLDKKHSHSPNHDGVLLRNEATFELDKGTPPKVIKNIFTQEC